MTTNPNGHAATATIRDAFGNVLRSQTFDDDSWFSGEKLQASSIDDALYYISANMAELPMMTIATLAADDGREWIFTCVKTAEVRK